MENLLLELVKNNEKMSFVLDAAEKGVHENEETVIELLRDIQENYSCIYQKYSVD